LPEPLLAFSVLADRPRCSVLLSLLIGAQVTRAAAPMPSLRGPAALRVLNAVTPTV